MNKQRPLTREEQIIRALAMEEAAQVFEAAGYVGHSPGPEGMGAETPAGNIVRALAPLPPGLVAVSVEKLEKLEQLARHVAHDASYLFDTISRGEP